MMGMSSRSDRGLGTSQLGVEVELHCEGPAFCRSQASWDFITCFVAILFVRIPSICCLQCLFSISSGAVRFPFKI